MRQVLGPGALGKLRGIGWRGRWEGGPGWGIHVNPQLIHVSVWQNPLQYCKVISLQLIKINEKKKKKNKTERDQVENKSRSISTALDHWKGTYKCIRLAKKSRTLGLPKSVNFWTFYVTFLSTNGHPFFLQWLILQKSCIYNGVKRNRFFYPQMVIQIDGISLWIDIGYTLLWRASKK